MYFSVVFPSSRFCYKLVCRMSRKLASPLKVGWRNISCVLFLVVLFVLKLIVAMIHTRLWCFDTCLMLKKYKSVYQSHVFLMLHVFEICIKVVRVLLRKHTRDIAIFSWCTSLYCSLFFILHMMQTREFFVAIACEFYWNSVDFCCKWISNNKFVAKPDFIDENMFRCNCLWFLLELFGIFVANQSTTQ